jgi:hypothetical protein
MTMKTYIGVKLINAEPMNANDAMEQGLLRLAPGDDFDASAPGYAVTYTTGYRSWSPAAPFEESHREVPEEDAPRLLADVLEYLEDIIVGPSAREDDGHCPEMRRLDALRIACASPFSLSTTDEAIVARARAFEGFLAGFTIAVAPAEPPKAAGATVDFNEMLECTDGSLWAEALLQSIENRPEDHAPIPRDQTIELLTVWFGNAIEAGRANGYKEALFTDEPVVDESKYPAWAQEPAPLPEFAQVDDPRLGQQAAEHSLDDEPVGDAPEGGDVELPAFEQRVPGAGEADYDDDRAL